MKVRKLAVALALVGGLGSGVAQALGLGEIELQSYLNEPLDAEIALPQSRGVDPADVFVNIASESAYERVGLNRNQFLSKLRFKVVTESDGSLAVNVSSREPLREPYLNFLLELTWPSGRLMREYAVLVDPPVYAEKSGVQDNVRAPAVSSSATGQRSSASNAAPRRQAQNRGYQRNTFGPTGPSDTLWEIAARVRPGDGVSMQQVMLAIQDLNPNAFIDGNINRLKRGEVLRMPSVDQMQSRTQAEATRVVSQQNREFQAPKRTVDATGKQSAQGDKAQAASGGDELKLLVAGDDASQSADGGSAGGDSELPGGVDAGTAVAMEELESARRENTELNSRVDDLQDQVQTLQRLLELKNNQLADLQKATGETDAVQAPSGDEAGSSEMTADADSSQMAEGEGTVATDNETGMMSGTDAVNPEAEGQTTGDEELAGTSDGADQGAEETPEAETAESSAETTAMGEGEQPGASDTDQASADTDMAANAPLAEESKAAKPAAKPAPEPAAADKGFPGNLIDAITSNPVYQFALGGGLLVLLLVLLLLARRNANREKAFYDQLHSESDEDNDSFDLSLDDDEESPQEASEDVLAEADAYIAYGRHDQAAQALETAISREPSRTDLRLKLLSVYADVQDRGSFEKQFGEIEALGDEQALADANELRGQLEEAESMPSIDDLESELRSDSFSRQAEAVEDEPSDFESDLANFDLSEGDESLLQEENEREESKDDLIEYDLSDISLGTDDDETPEKAVGSDLETEFETGFGEDEALKSSETDIQFETDAETESELETDPVDSLEADSAAEDSLELDEDSLELDENSFESDEDSLELEETSFELDETGLELDEDKLGESELGESLNEGLSEEFAEESVNAGSEGGIESLDESFLDELDAELDKVANEEDEPFDSDADESELDDLELDVSDEDLALMEEFSESVDTASEEEDVPSLDEELDLEDAFSDAEQDSPEEAADEDLPVASDEVVDNADASKREIADIDENDLGDDDDFDFLAGTDEAATKLDLARAYIEMGDSDGARDILEEVALEGNEEQKAEAQDLLKNMS